jgi:MFS family permease
VPPARLAVLAALHEPRYRQLWLSGIFVNTARWMDFLVLGWLALELTDSPLMVGVAVFARAVPMIAIGPFAGVLAERVDRGRLMIAVQLLSVAVSIALAVLFGSGAGGYGPLVMLEVLLGIASATDFPARRTALYTLVGPGRVTNAISLDSVAMQGTKIVGPVLGGVLLARLGAGGCYMALTLLHAAGLAFLLALTRRVALPPLAAGAPGGAGLAGAVREVGAHPLIRAVLLVTIVTNALVWPHQHILPVFARDVLAVGPELLGLLVAAEGMGALVGSLVIAAWPGFAHHGAVFAAGSLASALLVVAFAASRWYALSLPIQFLIGLGEAGFGTMQSAIVLLAAPERLRGRAMGILSTCIGVNPIGALWIGFFTGLVGAPAAAGIGGALAAVLMLRVVSRMASRDLSPASAFD